MEKGLVFYGKETETMNPFNSSAHRFSHRVRKRARTMSRILNRALVLLLIPLLTACGASSSEDASRSQSSISISQSQQTSSLQNESSLSSQSSQTAGADSQSEPYAPGYDFTADDIPPYTGNPVAIIHENVPFFEENEETTQAFQHYFDLDAFGRATMSYASLGQEIMPEEDRGDISSVHPTGFENKEYPFVENGYVYNRCHLVAYMLSGQNANPRNLITGTRTMNTKGMLPYETQTRDYIEQTGNHVMYRVTPIYKGNDLVAQGVLMEAKSVEDDGKGLQFCVFAYNREPGVAINYADGSNEADGTIAVGGTGQEQAAPSGDDAQAPAQAPAAEASYVCNTNTHKFHHPDCKSVADMKPKNRKDVVASRDALIAEGYQPCKRCNP